MDLFKDKYLKYKNKYLNLKKNLKGGSDRTLMIMPDTNSLPTKNQTNLVFDIHSHTFAIFNRLRMKMILEFTRSLFNFNNNDQHIKDVIKNIFSSDPITNPINNLNRFLNQLGNFDNVYYSLVDIIVNSNY